MPLPDPDLHLRESSDFILNSSLGRRALGCRAFFGLPVFLRDLLETMHRLVQSCHLPEFTDHGLSHLCSLVGRISEWTCITSAGKAAKLCDLIDQKESVVLLIATLIHDMGMLSQNPEDMPMYYGTLQDFDREDISNWVRKTHVPRVRGLLNRIFGTHSEHRVIFQNAETSDAMERAFKVAEAHDKWPWQNGFAELPDRDRGLAAVLAIADLLDEDATRCDTETLLNHRQGNMISLGHWIRHSLTVNRLVVFQSRVTVEMARPPSTDASFDIVFAALRNHFRLIGLYNEALRGLNAGTVTPAFSPETGGPSTEAQGLAGWDRLDGLCTQEALLFHVLASFMDFALGRGMTREEFERKGATGFEDIDLSFYDQIRFKQGIEARTFDEQCFYAILAEAPILGDAPGATPKSALAAISRGRLALSFLRKHALKSHRQGDGTKVSLLCSVAIEYVRSLQTAKRAVELDGESVLTLSNWWWSLVMDQYWLVDDPGHTGVSDILDGAHLGAHGEQNLKHVLRALIDLISQPFWERPDLFDSLRKTRLDWISSSNEDESLLLLSFIIELLWRRDLVKMADRWSTLANQWIDELEQRSDTSRVRDALRHLLIRLTVQTQAVWPGIVNKHKEDFIEMLSDTEKGLYKAWHAWFQRDWTDLEEALAELTPRIPFESPHDLAAYRLHHASRILRQKSGDPQWIGIMRMRTRASILGTRSRALREALSAVWGETVPGKAHERFHAYRLAHLSQIAALRSWDLMAWLQASGAVSSISLEVTRHENTSAWFAAEALWWGVLSSRLSETDRVIHRALSRLDLAEEQHRRGLVNALLSTRPIEYGHAAILFGLLGEAIPVDLLTAVAQWFVKYVNCPGRGFLWKLFPLSLWADILPLLDEKLAAEICEILEPAVSRFVSLPSAWVDDSRKKDMLPQYLRYAPLSLAIKAIEGVFHLENLSERENEVRWNLIYNAVIRRRELREIFKNHLIERARDPHTRFYIQFLLHADMKSEEIEDSEFRDWLKESLLRFTTIVLNRKPEGSIGPASVIRATILGNVSWRAEDGDVIEQLINMIDNAPALLSDELVDAINYIAIIVARGHQTLAHKVKEPLLRWLLKIPSGRAMFDDWKGPFSIAQASEADEEAVTSSLASLAAETVLKGVDDLSDPLAKWLTRQCFSGGPKSWREMVFLSMTVAKHAKNPLGVQLATLAQIVVARALQSRFASEDQDEYVVLMLTWIGTLMDPGEVSLNLYSAKNELARDAFFSCLHEIIPGLATYPNPDVRAAAARILRFWKQQGSMPKELDACFSRFGEDARARVRYEIRGGKNDKRYL